MPTGSPQPYEYVGTPRDRPSPLQNRVLPSGEIVAVPGRGLLTGNRGCLHGPDRRLGTARWRSPAWISCTLDWQGRVRDVMPPRRWTALFFLDETTALAAGHRPCAYCRRPEFTAFAGAWQESAGLERPPRAPDMDRQLHAERLDSLRHKATHGQVLGELPDFAMVVTQRSAEAVTTSAGFAIVQGGALRAWSWDGYAEPAVCPPDTIVDVLTPPAILGVLRAGYRPLLHPSLG